MTNGHSALRIFFGGTTTCYESNKSIQPTYSVAWKAHLCPETLQLSVRSLAGASNRGASSGQSCGILGKNSLVPAAAGLVKGWERNFWEEILRGGAWTPVGRSLELNEVI